MASDLQKIIAEIDSLSAQATFPVVQQALKELKLKQQSLLDHAKFQEAASSVPSKPAHSSSNRPLTKLTTYAYDESDKFVKLYYTLNGVQSLPAENVKSCFTDDSFDVTVTDLDGKDYNISARGFVHPIDAENSVVKQKSDMLLVMLKKSKAGTWSELLKIVHSKKEAAKLKDADPAMDSSDPQAGLMSMMKKLYEEGDDETKRSLRKAWHESQNKQGGGGLGGGFGGGDMPVYPRVWRHFNIGPGRELDSKSFEDALIFPRLKITATWEHSPDDSGYIFWMKTSNTASLGDIVTKDGPAVEEHNEEENEEVDPEEPGPYDPQLLWSCLSPGCEKQYMHKGDRDNHMIEGNHQLAPEQYSLEEYTFKVYKNILEGPHHARIANRKSLETDESTTDTQPKEGWALKAPKKGNRYTTDMRAFLDAELDLYRNNGNVKEIERKMAEVKSSDGRKRFVPEQRLTAQQIAAYYKRKKEKIQKRKGKGKQFTSEEEEAESDQIVREMNDETGEIEIEHEDDPMILSAEDEIRSCIEVQDKTQDESEQNIANLYEDEQELSMLFKQPPKKAANCPKKRKSKKNAKRS